MVAELIGLKVKAGSRPRHCAHVEKQTNPPQSRVLSLEWMLADNKGIRCLEKYKYDRQKWPYSLF
jgi:hypothetical protein